MTDQPSVSDRKPLSPAAQRALAEAEARRQAAAAHAKAAAKAAPKELRGPKGPEPTRYGDWERKGIASDF
ncbi:DUF1674 domain-containing protein [Bradyrhizobium sp. Cp5.3]|uniref:DUF1674 domain-containing protein n=1 Tax=Bradyrhizobium sp. Cp5.3 TaxID=443598 RepID=UPI0003FE102D|nr:DUF1674 domain-containing protein [Bradyrhizobium sp. Cp5.3]